MIAALLRRCSLIPVATFITGALLMANHVYDVGPDSTPLQLEMAGWLIYGAPMLLLIILAEVGRIVWVQTSSRA